MALSLSAIFAAHMQRLSSTVMQKRFEEVQHELG
jgi:hypothetical protein